MQSSASVPALKPFRGNRHGVLSSLNMKEDTLPDTKISDTVLNMPDTVAPRPPRRVNYCLPCVKKLSTIVKGDRRVAAGCMCERDNAGSKCDPCRVDKGNHNCDDIPAEFNRPLNILVHLQQTFLLESKDQDAKDRREERVRDYATKLVQAIQAFSKVTEAAVKKDKDFWAHRRASYEENKKRFDAGLGSVGNLTPVNQEVDTKIEQVYLHQWRSAGNWWYLRAVWFGQVA